MSIRQWIAERLCPDVFADQRAYIRMKDEASDAFWWLGGYPDAADAVRWLLDNDHNRRRPIGAKAIGKLPSSIWDFRSHLELRWTKPLAYVVWRQGRRGADDVEDYYEVAGPGDISADGSDPFPVFTHPAPSPKAPGYRRLEQLLYRLLRDHPEIDLAAHIGQTKDCDAVYSLPALHEKAQQLTATCASIATEGRING